MPFPLLRIKCGVFPFTYAWKARTTRICICSYDGKTHIHIFRSRDACFDCTFPRAAICLIWLDLNLNSSTFFMTNWMNWWPNNQFSEKISINFQHSKAKIPILSFVNPKSICVALTVPRNCWKLSTPASKSNSLSRHRILMLYLSLSMDFPQSFEPIFRHRQLIHVYVCWKRADAKMFRLNFRWRCTQSSTTTSSLSYLSNWLCTMYIHKCLSSDAIKLKISNNLVIFAHTNKSSSVFIYLQSKEPKKGKETEKATKKGTIAIANIKSLVRCVDCFYITFKESYTNNGKYRRKKEIIFFRAIFPSQATNDDWIE